MPVRDRFVRVPAEVLEALLRARLSGGQYRVLFWVIRHTYGWNRPGASFTWYRIARDIGLSRPAAYRAGQTLMAAGILVVQEGQVAIQVRNNDGRQLLIPGLDVAAKQRFSLPGSNATVAVTQPNRCQETTLFRRAKDSSKDKLKTFKDTHRSETDGSRRPRRPQGRREREGAPAGAARPISGKYDSLSQD